MIATQIEKSIRKQFYGAFWGRENYLATDIWESKLVQCIEGGVQMDFDGCKMPDRYLVTVPDSQMDSTTNNDHFIEKINTFVYNYAKESDYQLNNEVRVDVIKGTGKQDNNLDICGWISTIRPIENPHIATINKSIGSDGLKFIELSADVHYLVGRSNDAQIQLNEPYVSSFHSRFIINKNGMVRIKDLQSENGIYVMGMRLDSNIHYDFALPFTFVVGGVIEVKLQK